MGIMKNILLLNVGTRNVLVRNFKKTLRDRAKVIATDSYELAPAIYEANRHYITPKWTEKGYWERIKEIIEKENIGLIVSLIDSELTQLSMRSDEFSKYGVLINTSNASIIDSCYDKYRLLCFVKEEGYPWIKTFIDYETISRAIENGEIDFPLFSKPRRGSGSVGLRKVYNRTQLKEIFEESQDIIIQEYFCGQEIGVDLYVDLISGEPISVFAKKKLKMRAGETDKSVSYKNQKLFDTVISFAKKIGLRGANDIDVFEKNGDFYISEVNPRFGGGYIHAYAAGVDFPSFLINNMNGIKNTPCIGLYKEGIYMMKYFDICVMDGGEIYG